MRNREETLRNYAEHLWMMEKCESTIKKYKSTVREFLEYLGEQELSKEVVLTYKIGLLQKQYSARGINAKLAAVNNFLKFSGRAECCVSNEKVQREVFISEEKELTKNELKLLLEAAKGQRIYYIMTCMSQTGIRVSELCFITVEAAKAGTAVIKCKNKTRRILLAGSLCRTLLTYAEENGVKHGAVFVTKKGKPICRSKVWSEMKALCRVCDVGEKKVFPHNLRHLFATTYYEEERDIVKLADVLGHNNIQTTRIYTRTSGKEHRRILDAVAKTLNDVIEENSKKERNVDFVPALQG